MGSKKEKLNDKLFSNESKNWRKKDLEGVLLNNGFEKFNSTNHDTFIHPESKLKCQLPRHKEILPIYIEQVKKIILQKLQFEKNKKLD